MKTIYLIAALVMLAGCERVPEGVQQPVNAPPQEITLAVSERFQVQRVQRFRDFTAYNNERGIFVITDKKTGKEYIGISGVGIAETGDHSSGKTRTADER